MNSTLTPTDCGFNQLSVEQLNHIALKQCGKVGSIQPHETKSGYVKPRHGYKPVWVKDAPTQEHFMLLVGTNPTTQEMCRQGQIARMMSSTGKSYQLCDKVHTCATNVKYGREEKVLKTCVEFLHSPQMWNLFPNDPTKVKQWLWNNGLDMNGLTIPRIMSVYEIIQRYHSK